MPSLWLGVGETWYCKGVQTFCVGESWYHKGVQGLELGTICVGIYIDVLYMEGFSRSSRTIHSVHLRGSLVIDEFLQAEQTTPPAAVGVQSISQLQ